MHKEKIAYRKAVVEDIKLVIKFIKMLAEYEDMLENVNIDEDEMKNWLFNEKAAEVIFAMDEGVEIGFALYFYNFSTFTGRPGLYIEDAYIYPQYRGKGFGKSLFKELGRIAKEKKLKRLEWACLDCNKLGIDFYLSIGAEHFQDRRTFRLDDRKLEIFINS